MCAGLCRVVDAMVPAPQTNRFVQEKTVTNVPGFLDTESGSTPLSIVAAVSDRRNLLRSSTVRDRRYKSGRYVSYLSPTRRFEVEDFAKQILAAKREGDAPSVVILRSRVIPSRADGEEPHTCRLRLLLSESVHCI